MDRVDVYRMIRRRAGDAELDADICCHTFHATGITAYLDNGGTLEKAQAMAAHQSPRTNICSRDRKGCGKEGCGWSH
jgi:integrase